MRRTNDILASLVNLWRGERESERESERGKGRQTEKERDRRTVTQTGRESVCLHGKLSKDKRAAEKNQHTTTFTRWLASQWTSIRLMCSALNPRRLMDMFVILSCFLFPPFSLLRTASRPVLLPGSAASLGRCGFWKVSPCLRSRDLIVSRPKKIYPHVTEEARGGQQVLRDGEREAWFNGETVKLLPSHQETNQSRLMVKETVFGVWHSSLAATGTPSALYDSHSRPPPPTPPHTHHTHTHAHTHTHSHTHTLLK